MIQCKLTEGAYTIQNLVKQAAKIQLSPPTSERQR